MHPLNRVFVAMAVLIATGIASAQPQPPDLIWSKTYHVTDDDIDGWSFDSKPLSDGSFILTSKISTRWQADNLWLARIDSAGDFIWERSIGRNDSGEFIPADGSQRGKKICVTDIGDVGIVGTTNYGYNDIFFVLVDTSGNVLLKRSYGRDDRREDAIDICQTEGGFGILALDINPGLGTSGNILLLRVDDNGDSLWSQIYGEEGKDYLPGRILALNDGGFVFSGLSVGPNYDPGEPFLVRTDENGGVIWQRGYGDEGVEAFLGILQTGEDEFAVVTGSPTQNDPEGWYNRQITWIDGDGEILYAGDLILVPIHLSPRQFIRTTDGGYAICGDDFWMLRTDADGNELYQKVFGDTTEGQWSDAYAICATSDSSFAMGGIGPRDGVGGRWTTLMRLGPEVWPNAVREPDTAPQVFMLYPAFPNPFNSKTTIGYSLPQERNVVLEVYNLSGQRVQTLFSGSQRSGVYTISLDGASMTSGIYIAVLQAGEYFTAAKLEIVR